MNYLYYPGCSLDGSAVEYDISTRAVMNHLGVKLDEISEWSCCGASAAEALSELLSFVLPARNIALAESMAVKGDILVPCSACYLNLKKVEESVKVDSTVLGKINEVLDEDNLYLKNRLRTRHLLDVLSTDIGAERIEENVRRDLNGLSIAPYYGCQCLRPYSVFDDPERPVSMEPLLKACGCKIHVWNKGGICCGASSMTTKPEVAINLVCGILKAAKGADAIVTVCPMCQMNLDAYQKAASKHAGEDLSISVLYLPQLIGLAFGIHERALGFNYNLEVKGEFRRKIKAHV